MKIKQIISGFVMGSALLALLPSANAVPLNITVSGGASVVAAPKSDLGNFGDATVLNWLTSDVAAFNALTSATLPKPLSISGQTGLAGGTGGNSITLDVTGFDYLFFHWGGQLGGWAQAFYVGASTGSFTFDNTAIGVNPSVGGLSFYSFFGPTPHRQTVPDAGSTVLLLGAALSGLGVVVRRCKK